MTGSLMNTSLGAHETLELHEIAAFKTLCLTKSKTMQMLVTDPELKMLMQQDVQLSSRQLQELDGFLAQAAAPGVQA